MIVLYRIMNFASNVKKKERKRKEIDTRTTTSWTLSVIPEKRRNWDLDEEVIDITVVDSANNPRKKWKKKQNDTWSLIPHHELCQRLRKKAKGKKK